MSENNKKYILITAALIVIGAALYFFYWMRTPQYTFTQIHEAVQQHDLTKFEKRAVGAPNRPHSTRKARRTRMAKPFKRWIRRK